MRQTIRLRTFETNSSSYHSLSINRISEVPKPLEIEKGKDLVIDPSIKIHYIGCSSSYSHVSRGSYAKAQSVLRFMGYDLEEQLNELVKDEEWKKETNPGTGYYSYDWDIKKQLFKERFYQAPLIQAYVKAIKKYIGEEFNVTIKFKDRGELVETVGAYDKSTKEVFGVDDLTDIEKLSECFYNIIFNNDIEMIEECESND